MKSFVLAAAALAAGIAMANAQPAPGQDPHHPGPGQPQQQTPPPRPMGRGPGPGSGMPMQPGGMMMGGDMSQMMGMMQMMQMMQDGMMPMGRGPRAGGPFRHIEGQIAFYKAELKITDAQAPQWNAFAEALRASATRLQQGMPMPMQGGALSALTAPEQMERRIARLTAERDAMQAVLDAAKPLYAVLSDDQKKVADELMTEHMMGMRGRGM